MPDYAMCGGDGCEERERCFRYRATAGEWQSYCPTPTERPCPRFMTIDGWPERMLRPEGDPQ